MIHPLSFLMPLLLQTVYILVNQPTQSVWIPKCDVLPAHKDLEPKGKKLSCFVERVSNIFGLEPPLRGSKAPMKLVAFGSKIYHWKLKAISWVLRIRLSGQICCRLWAAHYCRLQKVLNLLKYPPSILETGIQCKYLLKNWTELIPPKISFKA